MALLRFTTQASLDLEEIIRFVGSRNPVAASKLTDRIEAECRRIADQPGMGPLRPDLLPGVRFFPIGSYLVFYRDRGVEGVQILRVLHGARDYGPADFDR